MCLAIAFVDDAQEVVAESDEVELVLDGPAPRQRGLLLVHHRVQELQPLVEAEAGVSAALHARRHVGAVARDGFDPGE